MNSATCKFAAVLTAILTGLCGFAAADISEAAKSPETPFALDQVALREAFAAGGDMPHKCRVAMKEFKKSIAEANANASTNRARLAASARKHLRASLSKAQESGNLDKVMEFRRALDTFNDGIEGNSEEIAKLRAARDAQLARIDSELAAAEPFAAALPEGYWRCVTRLQMR